MIQLEMQYFWSLTEQMDLDLDFSASEEYDTEKRIGYWKNIWVHYDPKNMLIDPSSH